MRITKVFGLFAIGVIAGVSFVGASSAMAEGSTALCRLNETPCSPAQRAAGVHGLAGTVLFKIGATTVLCLSSLTEGSVESATLANPLYLKTEILTWNQCGTTAAHNNCEVTNLALPLFDILHETTGSFIEGSATALGWKLKINCSNIFLNCVYGGEAGPFLLEAPETLMAKGGYSATLVFLTLESGLTCAKQAEFKAEYEWSVKLWTKT